MECEKVLILELVSDSATLQQGIVGITDTICYMMVSGVQHKILLNDRWVGPEIRKLPKFNPGTYERINYPAVSVVYREFSHRDETGNEIDKSALLVYQVYSVVRIWRKSARSDVTVH